MCFICIGMSSSQTSENTLKAVYLEKFSLFVTWPKESLMDNKNEPFIVVVYGDNEMYEVLKYVYLTQKIGNKNVLVKKAESYNQINEAHIVYIGDVSENELMRLVELSSNKNILTVASSRGYANKGVHINFFNQNNKLRFEINESAILKSPLKISFYLMSSARIVDPVKVNK